MSEKMSCRTGQDVTSLQKFSCEIVSPYLVFGMKAAHLTMSFFLSTILIFPAYVNNHIPVPSAQPIRA